MIDKSLKPRWILYVVLAIVLAFFSGILAKAASLGGDDELTSTNCSSLELVVLIDHSSSMEINDPGGLRFEALQQLVDQLGDHALHFCPGERHRLAVIGFSDQETRGRDPLSLDTYIYTQNVVIEPYIGRGDDLTNWITAREKLKAGLPTLEGDKFKISSGTDFLSAFKAARLIFDDWEQDENYSATNRKRAVFVITDGGPCILDEGCSEKKFIPIKQLAYMEQLADYLDPEGIGEFYYRGPHNTDSIQISLIALNDTTNPNYDFFAEDNDPAKDNPRDIWNRIIEDHGGRIVQVSTEDESNRTLVTQVYDVLSPIIFPLVERWECGEPLWVKPYENNIMVVTAWKVGTAPGDVPIQFIYTEPQAEEIVFSHKKPDESIHIADYSASSGYERYVFFQPPPGKYEVVLEGTTRCADLEVRINKNPITVNVLQPDGSPLPVVFDAPYYDQVYEPRFRIALTLKDFSGADVDFVELPLYPMEIYANVNSLDGQLNEVYRLSQVAEEPGAFQSDFIRTPIAGVYQWAITGETANPQSYLSKTSSEYSASPSTIFEIEGEFRVESVTRFGFSINTIDDGGVVKLNDLNSEGQVRLPIDVELQLVEYDLDGQVIGVLPAHEVFPNRDLSEVYVVSFLDQGGNLLDNEKFSAKKPMEGVFVARLWGDDDEKDILPEGKYTIVVEMVGMDYDRNHFAPVDLSREIEVQGVQVIPVGLSFAEDSEQQLYARSLFENASGKFNSLVFQAKLVDLSIDDEKEREKHPIFPEHALFDLENGPTVEIILPQNSEVEETAYQDAEGTLTAKLIGYPGRDSLYLVVEPDLPPIPGEYNVIVSMDDEILLDRYQWQGGPWNAKITRSVSWYWNPLAARIYIGLVFILVVVLIIVFYRMMFLGPTGTISMVSIRKEVAGPWRLKKNPSRNVIRTKELKRYGVKHIYVWRAKSVPGSTGDMIRRVKIKAFLDLNNQVIYSGNLEDNQPVPFVDEGDLVFKK